MRPVFFIVVCLSLLQCSDDKPAPNVAARVGTEEITIEELRLFAENMPELLHSKEEGLAASKDYLQTMIDMKLMLINARAKGLEKEAAFVEEWQEVRQKKLAEEYAQRQLAAKVELGEEEVRQGFKHSRWSRTLKLAHIRVETEELARDILRKLEQGQAFADLAAQYSTDTLTAAEGGVLKRDFIGREDLQEMRMPLNIAEQLFDTPVGEFSGPFHLHGQYEVLKVLDQTEAPPRYMRVFGRWLYKQKYEKAQADHIDELKSQYNVKLEQESVDFIIDRQSDADLWKVTQADQERILCRFDGGHLTVEDLIEAYWKARFTYNFQYDNDGVADFVDTYPLSAALFSREAVRLGLDQEPAVAIWLHNEQNAMLLEALKEREVQARLDTSEESTRLYYENNLHRFMDPRATVILEILVPTREQADSLLQEIRQGADMETLAVRHTQRTFAKKQQGRIHLHEFERTVFGPLHDEAMDKAEIGVLNGPLELKEGYSIFKVEERIPEKPETFEQAGHRAKYWLRKTQENKLFEELMVRLRQEHSAKVAVFEDHLKDLTL